MKPCLLSAALAAALLPCAALAQTTPLSRLDAVQVTATRAPQALNATLASVTVITRADIERLDPPDVFDLLRRQPGIAVARAGGSGSQTAVFVRGANSNQVLVLIDGTRAAMSTTGSFAWEHLPIDQIERIEIVRGPRASVWGSDAIGGVIAITTRKLDSGAAGLRIGRWGRVAAHAGYGVRSDSGSFSASVGGERSGGFNATRPGNFSFDPDRDGYRNRNLTLNGERALGTQRARASVYATSADIDFDRGESAIQSRALTAGIDGALGSNWTHDLTIGRFTDSLDTPAFSSRFETRRTTLDWLHRVSLGETTRLNVGYNGAWEKGASLDSGGGFSSYRGTRSNHALFSSVLGTHGRFDFEAALRHDRNSDFGGATTAQVAGGVALDAGRAFVSLGQGFRAPNLNELYSPGFGGRFRGNPELEPERSQTIELGADAALGAFDLGASVYRTRVRDLVAFQGSDFQAVNINRARLDGVETRAATDLGPLRVGAHLDWLKAVDARSGLQLLRRPKRSGGLSLEAPLGAQGRVSVDSVFAGPRRDFASTLGGYATIDVGYAHEFGGGWRGGVRLNNAFDRDYALAGGFTTPRREWLLTLSWRGAE